MMVLSTQLVRSGVYFLYTIIVLKMDTDLSLFSSTGRRGGGNGVHDHRIQYDASSHWSCQVE